MASSYSVAWWNLENLFDERDAPRSDKLERVIGNDLKNWTKALRDRKIQQLASILKRLGNGSGPDFLGVCEVENEAVLKLLVRSLEAETAKSYDFVHFDTSDQRGIDIAFIFRGELFSAPQNQRFQYTVMRRTATREILQVNFQTHKSRTWAIFGNHWPSRSGGELESEGYRQIAGETLAYFHQRVLEVHGKDTPVLVMGDLNDQPWNRSVVDHALSVQQVEKVLNATNPLLFNMMWEAAGRREGSLYFDNEPNLLDQFLVNRNMIREGSKIRAVLGSAKIQAFEQMRHSGDYPSPIPFGGIGPNSPANLNGYSDHFPIEMQVSELD